MLSHRPNSRDWAAGGHAGPGVGSYAGDTSGLVPRSGRREGGEARSISDASSSPSPPAFPLPCPLGPSAPRPSQLPAPPGTAARPRAGAPDALEGRGPSAALGAQRADFPDPARHRHLRGTRVCGHRPHSCLAPGLSGRPVPAAGRAALAKSRVCTRGRRDRGARRSARGGLRPLALARAWTRAHRLPAFKPAASQRLRLPEQDRRPDPVTLVAKNPAESVRPDPPPRRGSHSSSRRVRPPSGPAAQTWTAPPVWGAPSSGPRLASLPAPVPQLPAAGPKVSSRMALNKELLPRVVTAGFLQLEKEKEPQRFFLFCS